MLQVSPNRFGNLLMWPVGCPAPPEDSKELVNKHVHEWAKKNKDPLQGVSYGAYIFGGITLVSLFGFVKSLISSESKLLKWSLGILSGIGLAATGFFYECCYGSKHLNSLYNTFLLWPSRKIESTPEEHGITSYEKVEISSGEDKLKGYYLHSKKNAHCKKVILYLGGRRTNVGFGFNKCGKILDNVDANILLVDRRGFGESTGQATYENAMEDTETMYNYLINEKGYRPEDITIMGHSLGAGQAVKFAQNHPIGGLVLVNSITNTVDIVKDNTSSYLHGLADMLLEERLDCKNEVKTVKANKILILHCKDDKFVPLWRANEIYEKVKHLDSDFVTMLDGKHGEYVDGLDENCYKALRKIVGDLRIPT